MHVLSYWLQRALRTVGVVPGTTRPVHVPVRPAGPGDVAAVSSHHQHISPQEPIPNY